MMPSRAVDGAIEIGACHAAIGVSTASGSEASKMIDLHILSHSRRLLLQPNANATDASSV